MSNVFVIINEWVTTNGDEGSQVLGSKYFTTEDEAWAALNAVADSMDTYLPMSENNFSLNNHSSHLDYEEYYIQELTRG